MPTELNTFFYPKSVAVIGASRNPEKLGSIILKNIVDSGFSGTVFPVNPKAEDIQGLKSYSDVASLPEVPELAVIAIPVDFVNEVVEQLGIKGTKNVVVISAGYKEIGSKGATLEKELSSIALKHEINLLGPNCLGFINNYVPINATFAEGVKEVGNLRFLSQSGAIAAAMFDYFASTGLGISEFVTLGNKAGLTENEILEYFHAQTSNTLFNHKPDDLSDLSPIGMYLESISHGKSLAKIISEITKTDPVLIIKPGKTEAAAKAMQSHTGSIAGEDAVLDEVLKSAGAIRCDTLEEFFDYSRAFSWNNLPEGSGVTVISNAGGPAVITSDAIVNSGLQMTVLSETTKQNIKENLPESASVNNPVDVLGDALADRFKMAIEKSLSAEETNMLLVLLTPQLMTQPKETAQNIAELSRKYNKPVFASFIGGEGVAESIKILNKNKIPAYSYPEAAVKAMSVMWNFKKHQNSKKEQKDIEHIEVNPEMGSIRNVLQRAINEKQKTLDNQSVAHIFESCGIKTVPSKHAENIQDAISFAEEVSWPVVLKMSAPGLLHKKNIGGVEINIQNTNQLTGAWNSLTEKVNNLDPETRKNMSIEIQKQIIGGTEVIMGTRTDQTFGKIILFGTGGNYSQIVEDRNIHLLPINLNEAKELVANSKIYKLLQSYGEPTLNRLAEMLVRLGTISTMIPEASDIEINPVIVTEDAIWPVDGKIVLNEIERKPMPPTLIEAKCTKHEILADYFHYYEIETPEKFDFKPGQYISVKVAPDAIRAYSIATKISPTELGLLVDIRPGGPGSQFFEHLKEGDLVPFLGPFGVFKLDPEEKSDHLLFLGTGSGLSAVRCMVDMGLKEFGITKPMTLYIGLTHDHEIFWQDHFEDLKNNYPNFDYEFVILEPSENWQGEQGYNTKLVTKNFKDASNVSAYLCGHRAMIAGATEILQGLNCPDEQIYSERFV